MILIFKTVDLFLIYIFRSFLWCTGCFSCVRIFQTYFSYFFSFSLTTTYYFTGALAGASSIGLFDLSIIIDFSVF